MTDPLAVLITCHNRQATTIACLTALTMALEQANQPFHVYMCDDGCSDGTAPAAQALLGDRITVVRSDGSLFWNRGMIRAWQSCQEAGTIYRGLLLVNDDVVLDTSALIRLLELANQTDAPLVGQMRDPHSGAITYGGLRRGPWWRRLFMIPVVADQTPAPCEACNANLLFIPWPVVQAVGFLDPVFHHSMGDWDWGLRAVRTGHPPLIVPGALGTCPRNPVIGTWRDRSLPRMVRFRKWLGPKGCPPWQWHVFAWRHGGILGPLAVPVAVLKILLGR